jgi:hypothetical protein
LQPEPSQTWPANCRPSTPQPLPQPQDASHPQPGSQHPPPRPQSESKQNRLHKPAVWAMAGDAIISDATSSSAQVRTAIDMKISSARTSESRRNRVCAIGPMMSAPPDSLVADTKRALTCRAGNGGFTNHRRAGCRDCRKIATIGKVPR